MLPIDFPSDNISLKPYASYNTRLAHDPWYVNFLLNVLNCHVIYCVFVSKDITYTTQFRTTIRETNFHIRTTEYENT
jgi:hypothetical protein